MITATKELSMRVVLNPEEVASLCGKVNARTPEEALAMHTDRMLSRTFRDLTQRWVGMGYIILVGTYGGMPIEMQVGTGILDRYSGPETDHIKVDGAGIVSLCVCGEGVDHALLEDQVRQYFRNPETISLN